MKRFLINSIVFQTVIILNCFAQTTGWEVVKSNTNKNLNSIFFYDYQTGFACGDSGVVLKSIDSGKTWQSLQSPVTLNLNDCFIFSQDCAIAVGDSSIGIGTYDGGNTWSAWPIYIKPENTYCVSFSKDQWIYFGIFGADSQYIFSGDNTYCSTLINNVQGGYEAGGFLAAQMLTPKIAFVAGENSLFQPILGRTTNYGNSWEIVSFNLNGENGRATGVAFTDSLVGYISAKVWDGRGAIAKTTNSGYDWTTTFFSNSLNSINFPKSVINGVGYCVGESGTILKTLGNGESWYQQVSGTNENLNKVFFIDSNFGFAVGDNGIILRTTTGGGPVTNNDNKDGQLLEFELQQNYPNPFNPSTTIRYSVRQTLKVDLKVYDILGNKIATLVNEEKPEGEYEISFDGTRLPSGIYIYQLSARSEAENYISTRKMVLLK